MYQCLLQCKWCSVWGPKAPAARQPIIWNSNHLNCEGRGWGLRRISVVLSAHVRLQKIYYSHCNRTSFCTRNHKPVCSTPNILSHNWLTKVCCIPSVCSALMMHSYSIEYSNGIVYFNAIVEFTLRQRLFTVTLRAMHSKDNIFSRTKHLWFSQINRHPWKINAMKI